MSKLVLFDGNAIMHRAYHALPPLTARNGEPINAVYGLISMLLKVIQDVKPTHIIFAFDREEPTFRKEILESYQSHRPEMEEALSGQFKKAAEVIKALGIPLYDKAGFEADDVIGTIAHSLSFPRRRESRHNIGIDSGSKAGMTKVLIITGDRDMLQLVDEENDIKLYMPLKGLSDAKEFGVAETIERIGVAPEQIVDYKALVGDPSDNYKGVPGIGPKTAVTLLEEYKTLGNIYKNLDKLPEKLKLKLLENKENAYQSQKLAKIVTDVDIDFDLEKAAKWQVNSDKAVKLFEEYGFRTLTKRIKNVGKAVATEKQMGLF
jgi:DNA polymerase-1